jgi:integrase
MASVHRKGKRWVVRWRLGGRGAKNNTKGFRRSLDAESFCRELNLKIAAASPHDGYTTILWPELVARYCSSRPDATADHRAKASRVLLALGDDHGWKCAADVGMDVAPVLKIHQRRLLRALLRFASDNGQRIDQRLIPAMRPRPPRRQPQNLLTESRIDELLAKAEKWHPANAAIGHLVSTYGHRVESLRLLTPEALTTRPGWLRLRVKSGDIHEHPILSVTAGLLSPLAAAVAPGAPFLVGHLGRPWASGSEFSAWWIHAIASERKDGKAIPARGAGVLDLRRYAITRMMGNTGDPKTVASITGHRTPSLLLNVYARTTEDRQRKALEAIAGVPPCSHNLVVSN